MKKIILSLITLTIVGFSYGQTLEELKAEKAAKKDSISAIEKRIADIQGQIDTYPGWKIGAFGTIGGSFSGYNDWYSKSDPNSSAGSIGVVVNAFANLDREKYFWKNSGNVNLSWVQIDDKDDPNDDDSWREANDAIAVSSLFGYKLTSKIAVSALGEYRTTVGNFNDPGYLDLGVGATWTPITNLVVVVHPLNYNFVFSEGNSVYESSMGTKLVADYTRQMGAISFKSNLSAFLSYESSNYSNWTWTNSFGYTLWKGIGVGFDFGLRQNKQEALNWALNKDNPNQDPAANYDNVDNALQSFWLLGLSYSF
ncbi:MAG: hypothetical protein CSA39_03555 [Flavobacteriales bacterium]|nr:MAG: hypothetical protein CR989_01510 [Flavobacteriales bacterium]PIE49243.1 MAG: hypothetical protein CSA39_03555 [Flavobacteriales bacterium]